MGLSTCNCTRPLAGNNLVSLKQYRLKILLIFFKIIRKLLNSLNFPEIFSLF